MICLFLNNTFLASGPTKLSVPGFSLDDAITSDDVQEDTGSDPNKRLLFTVFNILYIFKSCEQRSS